MLGMVAVRSRSKKAAQNLNGLSTLLLGEWDERHNMKSSINSSTRFIISTAGSGKSKKSYISVLRVALKYSSEDLWKSIEKHGPKRHDYRDPDYMSKRVDEYYRRHEFTGNYAWAVPTKEAIEKIRAFVGSGKVLEIGSGLGLWAKLLKDEGIHVTPTDFKGQRKNFGMKEVEHTEVHDMGHMRAMEMFGAGHDVLMMIWPPYDDSMAAEALERFKGDKLIYIGESGGGCTGDDRFHQLLDETWNEKETVDIPQWDGIHDALFLYERK